MARDKRSDKREKMSTTYLSKEEVAKRMRELADNIKNSDLAVEIQELADRVEKEGELEQYIRMKKLSRARANKRETDESVPLGQIQPWPE